MSEGEKLAFPEGGVDSADLRTLLEASGVDLDGHGAVLARLDQQRTFTWAQINAICHQIGGINNPYKPPRRQRASCFLDFLV
jgi:hypothetical protein